MKSRLKLSIILILFFPLFLFSQSALFEVKWTISGINYSSLIVLDGAENSYARVNYISEGSRKLITQNLKISSQNLITGGILYSLVGNNVKNIIGQVNDYNPDIFSFHQNESGFINDFKVGDNKNPLFKVSNFKKIETADRGLLKQYFNELEEEFTKVLKTYGSGGNVPQKSENVVANVLNALASTKPSFIQFQNNTGKDIFVALCYFDKTNNGWTSVGWYKVDKYSEFKYELGIYSGYVYVHGEDNSLITGTWGSGYSLCVDPTKSFRILNADKVNCSKKKEFSKFYVSAGVNKYTFNP